MQEPYRIKAKYNLVGMQFGRLTVIERADDYVTPKGYHFTKWKCKCSCNNQKIVSVTQRALLHDKTKSCGCLFREISRERNRKHDNHDKRIYNIYYDMKTRCYNIKSPTYKIYGGRGITICDEWLGKNGFINFYNWAINNGYKEEVLSNGISKWSIDRIDNNKGYFPDNCRWATCKEQARNRRTNRLLEFDGKIQPLKKWAEEYNIPDYILANRLNNGWSVEKAITTPHIKNKSKEEIKQTKINILEDINKGMKNVDVAKKYKCSTSYIWKIKNETLKDQDNERL